jgi:hypothetical protein
MAGDFDTSGFPPNINMTPEVVSPVVGWLCHEDCSVTGQMLIAQGGRVAKAFIAESPGVYRDNWAIEDVDDQMEAISSISRPLMFPSVPQGHIDHVYYAFKMADDAHAAKT